MILLIIFGVLFIAGLVFVILGFKDRWDNYDMNFTSIIIGTIPNIIGIGGLIGCVIAISVTHSPLYRDNKRVQYQEQINAINNTRKALEEQLQSSTLTILEVSAYNDTVRDFKVSLKQDQRETQSTWIGILCCQVCNEFSVDAVSYLYVGD